MKKRVLSLSLALAMAASLTACGSSSSTTETTAVAAADATTAAAGASSEASSDKVFKIGGIGPVTARLLYMVSQLRTAHRSLLMRSTLTAVSTDTRSSLIPG